MELHAPVLHLPEIKYLVDQAKQDMHILFHQLEELARLSVEGAVGASCSMGSAISVSGVRKSCEIFVKNTSLARSLLQFMGKLFQLRLLHFQQFLLLYQLSFLFFQFLFCMDSSRFNRFLHARRGRQPPTNRPATIGRTDCHTRQPCCVA